jgi:hypothetical protein
MTTLTPELEAKLQRVLAERSTPGAVTDYRAGTLSDQDREDSLRMALAISEAGEADKVLTITDKTILDWPC